MEKVTNDGVTLLKESKTMGTSLELVEGMQFDRGYVSGYMATDTDNIGSSFGRSILHTDKKISNIRKSYLSLNKLFSKERNLLSLQKMLRVKLLQP